MAFVSLRQVLDHAAEHGYGVPAFNVNNLEQILAIMEAAQETDSPVILQASAGARKYAGEAYLRHMMLAAVETHPDIPVVVHQDHGASPAVCIQSIRSGFTSVMMDGSLMEDAKTPASYGYNVAVTRQVCAMAHAIGVSVEGELGCLGSLETGDAGEEDGSGAEGKLTPLTTGRNFRQPTTCASGGGGLVSTAADYLRFCEAMRNGGALGDVRLLGPKTVALMRANHLPDGRDLADLSVSLFSEATYRGVGFGLGFAMTTDVARTGIAGSVGEYWWGGAASTAFWIDPVEDLSVVFLTQFMPSSLYPIRRELRTMVNAAVIDSKA